MSQSPADPAREFPDPHPVLLGATVAGLRLLLSAAEKSLGDFDARQQLILRTVMTQVEQAVTDAEAEAATPLDQAGVTYVVRGRDQNGSLGADTLGEALAEVCALLLTDGVPSVSITRRAD